MKSITRRRRSRNRLAKAATSLADWCNENGRASGADWFRIPRDQRPPLTSWFSSGPPLRPLPRTDESWFPIRRGWLGRRDDPSDLVLVFFFVVFVVVAVVERDRHEIVLPSTSLRGMLKDELYLANEETHFQGCDLYWRIVYNFAYCPWPFDSIPICALTIKLRE